MLTFALFARRRYRAVLERAAQAETALQTQLAHARSERALLVAKAQFRAVFDRAPQGMVLIDRNGRVLETNDAARAATGMTPGIVAEHRAVVVELFAGIREAYAAEIELPGADGSRWIEITISIVHDDGAPLFAIAIMHDITERKVMEDQLVFDATHDPLTGLPNRKLFVDLLQRSIERPRDVKNAFCRHFHRFQ